MGYSWHSYNTGNKVPHRVNRQPQRRPDAGSNQGKRAHQHEYALVEGKFEEAVDHVREAGLSRGLRGLLGRSQQVKLRS